MTSKKEIISLDGNSLTPELLCRVGYDSTVRKLTKSSWERVKAGRKVVDDKVDKKEVTYGINTGFGLFSNISIPEHDLKQLQLNLIRSHACGQGAYLTVPLTRMLLALRINTLAKGHSGVSCETLQQLVDALNLNCISCVPTQGTVGASGDLAPLAHLVLGLLGEGEMWDTEKTFPTPAQASVVLKKHNLKILDLKAKEGLALINGTQFITGLGCEALVRAEKLARQADVIAAMSLEALRGTVRAFDDKIHLTRPHNGQILSATRIRHLLHTKANPSEISLSHANCGSVQDAYTLRCVPQVHGIVLDTLAFVRKILTTEINSATDNPMIFCKSWYEQLEKDDIISGGNFHGEYPAKVLDFLAIAVHELGNISERRIERLNNPDLSHLPAFLVKNGGLNSDTFFCYNIFGKGFMLAHCTAASLVSENKVLCHPSSIDSLSTSGAKEDHVSMGGFAARKALEVVGNVEKILGIELLCACQGIDLLSPLKSTRSLQQVHEIVRKV
ncbi:hypothetical protein RFI_00862 [Reticulomyxa filosa]|uniref:Histidine ammonia-lyase n=1 Tax=Reticulomyxa filosa TaxID=46433 RepID=X6PCE7_RETFI|nr:hypothetical protein RFI_00862 [Reticulomyxa filosa]|eukprot:ETO36200.1 hypothetical protein RFI_00862 [Reticulomyxa filosa]